MADDEASGAFAPFGHRAFLWFWLAFVASTIGTSMQTLGAQWYLVAGGAPAATVALVQGAVALPMALLALPAGVLADLLPRRSLIAWVQASGLVLAVGVTLVTEVGTAGPTLLLGLIFLIGCAYALTLTPLQALVPDVVDPSRLTASAALISVAANIARVVGPAVAGVVVAHSGVPTVFALSALANVLFVVVALRWDGGPARAGERERFWRAALGGLRYARHSPQMLRLMLRSFWFTSATVSLFALLPLVATRRLGVGPDLYGVLFACLGAGAIAGGLSVNRLLQMTSPNRIVAAGFSTCAVSIALLPTTTTLPATMAVLLLGGWGWTACLSTMAGAIQLYLPAWVRARGLAVYSVALFSGQTLGSVALGLLVEQVGLGPTLWVAAGTLALGAPLARWWPLVDVRGLDRRPAAYWPEPATVLDPDDLGGEVVVMVTYLLDDAHLDRFQEVMARVRRIRLRTGATSWRLLRDAETPRRYIEEYAVATWDEHARQRASRLVASDQQTEHEVARLCDGPPRVVRHLRLHPAHPHAHDTTIRRTP